MRLIRRTGISIVALLIVAAGIGGPAIAETPPPPPPPPPDTAKSRPPTQRELNEQITNALVTGDGGEVTAGQSGRVPTQGGASSQGYDPNAVGSDGLTDAQRYGVCVAVQVVLGVMEGTPLDRGPCNATPMTPVDVAVLARAELHLPLPTIQAWPPTDREVAGLRAWFHVDTFAPASATAAAGSISATVSARPTAVIWHLGETTLTCTSAGAVWQPGAASDATDCSYVFQRYTKGETITATVDVRYHLTWTANAGDGGDLGTVTRTTAFPLRVWEIQAVIN